MPGTDKPRPPIADPRKGKNAGYAEEQPRDKGEARQDVVPPKPSPDESGPHHDADAQPDPATGP